MERSREKQKNGVSLARFLRSASIASRVLVGILN
jgi:hypothetical protein